MKNRVVMSIPPEVMNAILEKCMKDNTPKPFFESDHERMLAIKEFTPVHHATHEQLTPDDPELVF